MKSNTKLAISAAALTTGISMSSASHAIDISLLAKQKSSYAYLENEWQQHDVQLDLETLHSVGAGDLTTLVRVNLDAESSLNHPETPNTYDHPVRNHNPHSQAALREFYWEWQGEHSYWKIGKQQVVWGEADGLKLLDIVNPQSFREFILDDFDDSRIPLWMINSEFNLSDNGVLQILVIPDTTTHELAPQSSPYNFTSTLLVPASPPPGIQVSIDGPEAPHQSIKEGDIGARYSVFWDGWDLSFNYLFHTIDDPVLRTRLNVNVAEIAVDYERSHLFGGTASSAFGDWTIRAEFAFESDRFHRTNDALPGIAKAHQLGSVIGLDFQGWSDQFWSIQWFQTRINNHTSAMVRKQNEQTLSLLAEINFMNETLKFSWLHLYSLNRHDGLMRPKVSYNLTTNFDVSLGADRFFGTRPGLFGQFDGNDRLYLEFEVGFD